MACSPGRVRARSGGSVRREAPATVRAAQGSSAPIRRAQAHAAERRPSVLIAIVGVALAAVRRAATVARSDAALPERVSRPPGHRCSRRLAGASAHLPAGSTAPSCAADVSCAGRSTYRAVRCYVRRRDAAGHVGRRSDGIPMASYRSRRRDDQRRSTRCVPMLVPVHNGCTGRRHAGRGLADASLSSSRPHRSAAATRSTTYPCGSRRGKMAIGSRRRRRVVGGQRIAKFTISNLHRHRQRRSAE